MLKNYFKIAFRNMLLKKGFSITSIFGLSIGIAACLIMLMYVVNETSFDNFHYKKDRIHRVVLEWGTEGSKTKFAGIFPGVGPALKEQFPEVEKAIRITKEENVEISFDNSKFLEERIFYCESDIFEIFSYEFLIGAKENALVEPYSLVITENISKKYFGDQNPIGKTVKFGDNLMRVTGVIKNIPKNTHLNMELLVSYSTLLASGIESEGLWNSWGSTYTYFLLREGYNIQNIPGKLSDLLAKNGGDFMAKSTHFTIQELKDIHFSNDYRVDLGPKSNILYIYIFLTASILILTLACFNFVNLMLSRYFDRIKEVGIRKVLGAGKYEILKQFLSDSLLMTLISLCLGGVIFEIFYREIFQYLGSETVLSLSHLQYFILIILGIIFTVGILSGGYPALFLSKFNPNDIIRKNFTMSSSKIPMKKILIILQFAITLIILTGTLVVYRQLYFMRNSDLGFEKENVAVINLGGNAKNYYALREELKKQNGITAVSGAFLLPGSSGSANLEVQKKGFSEERRLRCSNVFADFDFVKTLGLKVVQGRDFSFNYSNDANESVLINETAAKELNLQNPIGERLLVPRKNELKEVSIIGIVKDFHMQSKHNKIAPMLIQIEPNYISMVIKMLPYNMNRTLADIKEVWKKIAPGTIPNIVFLDDVVNRSYKSEAKIGNFMAGFAFLAIIISCLGLSGLTSFIATKKKKEIGIRKVLGASIGKIASLLSIQFLRWIILSNLIALPVAYLLINKWLQNFVYRIDIGPFIFIVSSMIVFLVAFLTIGIHIFKAVNENPVDALRCE